MLISNYINISTWKKHTDHTTDAKSGYYTPKIKISMFCAQISKFFCGKICILAEQFLSGSKQSKYCFWSIIQEPLGLLKVHITAVDNFEIAHKNVNFWLGV